MSLCRHGLYLTNCTLCKAEELETVSVLRISQDIYLIPYDLHVGQYLCLKYDQALPNQLEENYPISISDKGKYMVLSDDVPQSVIESIRNVLADWCCVSVKQRIYVNHCWACKGDVDSQFDYACERCAWYICRFCKACGCEYSGLVSRSEGPINAVIPNRDRFLKVLVAIKRWLSGSLSSDINK